MHIYHFVEIKFQFELCDKVFSELTAILIITFGILKLNFDLNKFIDDVAKLARNPKYATFYFLCFENGHDGLGFKLDEFKGRATEVDIVFALVDIEEDFIIR